MCVFVFKQVCRDINGGGEKDKIGHEDPDRSGVGRTVACVITVQVLLVNQTLQINHGDEFVPCTPLRLIKIKDDSLF